MGRKSTPVVHLGGRTQTVVLGPDWWRKPRESSNASDLVIAKPMPSPFDDAEVYTAAEIATTLKVARCTVYEWIRLGELEAQPLLRGHRVMGSKVNEFLQRMRIRNLQARG